MQRCSANFLLLPARVARAGGSMCATLIETTSHQSDDINFLLRGQADQREQMARLVAGQAALEAGQAAINERLDGFGQMLTAILNAVQKPSGN